MLPGVESIKQGNSCREEHSKEVMFELRYMIKHHRKSRRQRRAGETLEVRKRLRKCSQAGVQSLSSEGVWCSSAWSNPIGLS